MPRDLLRPTADEILTDDPAYDRLLELLGEKIPLNQKGQPNGVASLDINGLILLSQIPPGAEGPAGADGRTVRSGAMNPSSGLGNNGDFYINTTSYQIFGPKTSGSWGAGTNLIGSQGTPGTNGANGATGPQGALPTRNTATYTTASIASGIAETGTINLGKSYRLLRIDTTRPCRVRLYTTATKQSADISRPVTTDPSGDHGLLFEGVLTSMLTGFDLFPEVFGASLETTPTVNIPITVNNNDTVTGTVGVTFIKQTWE